MKTRSATERLAAAQAKQTALANQIAATEAARREALLADDDAGAAAADRELIELRLAVRRAVDQIELIVPLIEAERLQADWPHDPINAKIKLEQMCEQRRVLNAKRPVNRSAYDQQQLDHLICAIPAMKKHIAHLERMAA